MLDGVQGSQYGARVMGEAEWVKDQQTHAARASIYGGRLMGGSEYGDGVHKDIPPAMVVPEGPLDRRALYGVSVAALADILTAQPSLFNDAVECELERPEGPRVGALALLIQTAEAGNKDPKLIAALRSFMPTPAAAPAVVEVVAEEPKVEEAEADTEEA